ncbi:MAG: sensor domain-containing diguanylate cyclase [Phycisphaerae bacterium]
MSQMTISAAVGNAPTTLEQQIRTRIESLSHLPTTVAVAMKLVELRNNPDAEPSEYAKVIGADASLSAKLLALANSPWFGIRNKITTVRNAINLLGLGTVRTMAISYCMAGLHNELRLSRNESRRFWETCLCKAVAARCCAQKLNHAVAEEAFVAGLFEDLAVPVMYSVARQQYLAILADPACDVQSQLQREHDLFHLDHTEFGRILAQKLELPEVFVDAIAFHHDRKRLKTFLTNEATAQALHIAALFPHILDAWNAQDANELCCIIDETEGLNDTGPTAFLQEVQNGIDEYYRFFDEGGRLDKQLSDLLIQTAKEGSENTEHLVKTVHRLMQEAASAGLQMNQLIDRNTTLTDKTTRDQLTNLLNREGFAASAEQILAKASRYGNSFAVAFFDIDRFKAFNDTYGHQFGDRVLTSIAQCFTTFTRKQDIKARVGGDEFILLLPDCGQAEAQDTVKRLLEQVAAAPIGRHTDQAQATLSAGLLYVTPSHTQHPLEGLIDAADKLMYESKQAGGNRITTRVI